MDTLPKSERLKSMTAVSALMSKGRWGFAHGLKYCHFQNTPPEGPNRILVSVPKRLFKRAVKRNLLKRRMREAYRLQKDLLAPSGTDVMFVYNTQEILDLQTIKEQVRSILTKIGDERQQ